MTPQTKTQAPAAATKTAETKTDPKELSDFEKLLLQDAKTRIEYKPFQSNTTIAISAKMVRDYIAVPAKGQDGKEIWPDDRQCVKFILLCLARQLNPYEGDAFMLPFWNKNLSKHEWSLITAHNALLKRAEVHPHFDGKRSGIIVDPPIPCLPCKGNGIIEGTDKLCPRCQGVGSFDEVEGDYLPKDKTLLGGWCKVFYQDKKNPEYQRLKLSTYSKPWGNWSFDGAGMICKCAEAASLRSAFPNTMGGMYLREEMGIRDEGEIPSDPVFSRPIFTKTAVSKTPEPENGQGGVAGQGVGQAQTSEPGQNTPSNAPEGSQGQTTQTNTGKMLEQAGKFAELRKLCKADKIKETELVGFLIEIGSAEPGTESLETLALENESVLEMVTKQWADVSQRILAARNVPE